MVQKLVIATKNLHKVEEFQAILKPFGVKVVPYSEVLKEEFDIDENGKTFEDNAKIKAEFISKKTGLMTVADDSGFCITKLSDFPGVKSARFIDEMGSSEAAFEELTKRLGNKFSGAKFVCTIALARQGEKTVVFRGECNGFAVFPPRGESGFGYDPVFVPNGYGKTFAEMTADEKNAISHRAVASEAFIKFFQKMIDDEKLKQKLDVKQEQNASNTEENKEKVLEVTEKISERVEKKSKSSKAAAKVKEEQIVVEKAEVCIEEVDKNSFNVEVDYKFEKSE